MAFHITVVLDFPTEELVVARGLVFATAHNGKADWTRRSSDSSENVIAEYTYYKTTFAIDNVMYLVVLVYSREK